MKKIDLRNVIIDETGKQMKAGEKQATLADLLVKFIIANNEVKLIPTKVYDWVINIPKDDFLECDETDYKLIVEIVEKGKPFNPSGLNDFFRGQLLKELR